jgi:hypothetical protein
MASSDGGTVRLSIRAVCALRSASRWAAGDNHGDLAANQVGRQSRQPIVLILCPPVCDRHVLALDMPGLPQALTESAQPVRHRVGRSGIEESNHRRRRLPRARRKRPSDCGAAERAKKFAPSHAPPQAKGRHCNSEDKLSGRGWELTSAGVIERAPNVSFGSRAAVLGRPAHGRLPSKTLREYGHSCSAAQCQEETFRLLSHTCILVAPVLMGGVAREPVICRRRAHRRPGTTSTPRIPRFDTRQPQ